MNSSQLKATRELFRAVKEKASRLDYYVGLIRVTHTKKELEQLVKAVHAVDKIAIGIERFADDFVFCMRRSRVGSLNIERLNTQEIAISGVFNIEALRDALIAVDNVPQTIDGKVQE